MAPLLEVVETPGDGSLKPQGVSTTPFSCHLAPGVHP